MDNELQNNNPLAEQEHVEVPLPQDAPDFLKGDKWFGACSEEDFLDFTEPYTPPRYTLQRGETKFANVGDLHIISGKPGNGKTGLMKMLMAAILSGKYGGLEYALSKERPNPIELYIDTEQSKDDTIAFKNSVCVMSGIDYKVAHKNFYVLRLRDVEDVAERWRKILDAIWKVRPTDIFLDGMLDIVKDYNDQVECQPIIRKCMMLATYYDASLWAVLHENPLVDKLVGVLGSITQRKVSEIFTVQKIKQCDLKENDRRADLPDIYFRVKQVKARGKDVNDWLFEYVASAGGWGQPVEIADNGTKFVNDREMAFMKEADERLKAFNWTSAGATYTELERYLRKSVSGRRAGDLINIAAEHGIIYKSDKKKYHYNGIKELPKDNVQDLPFEAGNEEVPY